ncbi:MAG: sodium:proton antiporter [Planctomycetaceae bacterium]
MNERSDNVEDSERILISLSGILVLGVGSQWLAGGLKIPSILMLLTVGIVAGPVTGFIQPDPLFGDLILPIVSLAVAVVLFEGAMSLHVSELREIGRPLIMLLTAGVVITGVACSLAGYFVLRFDLTNSILLGSLLTVTGPTVVGPLLHHIRPVGRVGPLARWEGIVVDPIGAVLAVLAFAALKDVGVAEFHDAVRIGVFGFMWTFVAGTVIGVIGAFLLKELLRRHWITDHLQSPMVLMMVVLAFVTSNLIQHESGLVAVTMMGLMLANQKAVPVGHIVQFKEDLSVLLISSLFIVLAARLDLNQFVNFGWRGPVFVAIVILVVRPLSVMVSTIGCGLSMAERLLLSWLAPRGIVAAAVASVFALQLPDGGGFVAAVFLVIVGTVVVYGLSAAWVARKLGLSISNPQGVMFAGAHSGIRAIALALQKNGIIVQLVDTDTENIRNSRMEGLPTVLANILSERVQNLNLGGLGRLLAMTRNREVNILAMRRGAELFGRKEAYRLSISPALSDRRDPSTKVMEGRVLFGNDATYEELDRRFAAGAIVKGTRLTLEFTSEDFFRKYPTALPLFVIDDSGQLTVCTTDADIALLPEHTVIAMIDPLPDNPDADTPDTENTDADKSNET